MTQIETWILSPLPTALAKTLLHSLWEAGLAALGLAACLRFIRSSRLRYAAACAALVATIVISAATFTFLKPAPFQGQPQRFLSLGWPLQSPDAPAGTVGDVPRSTFLRILPWITPVWLLGVLLSTLCRAAGWVASERLCRVAVCNAPEAWLQKLKSIRARMNVTKAVALLESSRTQIPVVIGYVRPAILLPVGLLTGMPAEQIELILMHELAHVRRADYLFNMLQTVVESIMFYNPGIWWISSVIRTERENCCDDVVLETTNAGPLYAAALTALEENRSNQMEVGMAATGGSLVKRIRRILRQSEPQTSAAVPMLSTAAVIVVIGGLLAAHPAALSQPASVVAPAIVPAVQSTAAPGTATGTGPSIGQNAVPASNQNFVQNAFTGKWVDEGVAYVIAPEERAAFNSASRLSAMGAAPSIRQNAVPARTQIVVENAYTKWLNEDVVYIITPEERAAFLGLSTDAERDRFIEQFWQRRDPTPGTAQNEFKDEHYRRIAYANDHFTSKVGLPQGAGWRMDRGRIYILWGAPDEMESHPEGGTYVTGGGTTQTFPFEIWRYRFIQGVGNDVLLEFVDPNGTGEFKWSTDPQGKVRGLVR
jgi:GWxTD domain-containing protein